MFGLSEESPGSWLEKELAERKNSTITEAASRLVQAEMAQTLGHMTIRYTNTFRDVMAFCFYHYPRSPFIIGSYGFAFVIISLAIFQAMPNDATNVVKAITFFIMEFLAFAFIAGIFALTIILGMVSRRNKTLLTEHVITLEDGSFIEETTYNKTDHKWAGVQKLACTRGYIFIYVAQHAAHVVPRRAFRDHKEWDSFYDFCRQRVGAF